jgi:hypothetical protein
MMSLFARARAYLNLTPGERAFLKLLGGIAGTAVVAAILAAAQVLAGTPPNQVSWQVVLHVAAGAFLAALWTALAKYYKAYGDPPLPGPTAGT